MKSFFKKAGNNKNAEVLLQELKSLQSEKEQLFKEIEQQRKRLKVIKHDLDLRLKEKYNHKIYKNKELFDLSNFIVNVAKRENIPVSMMFIHIKNMDENFSKKVTEEVINTLLSIIDFYTRDSDIIAQLSNSEYALLLSYTDIEGCKILKKKLMDKIKNQVIETETDRLPLSVGFEMTQMNIERKETILDTLERLEEKYFN